jgi:hypothetical protein
VVSTSRRWVDSVSGSSTSTARSSTSLEFAWSAFDWIKASFDAVRNRQVTMDRKAVVARHCAALTARDQATPLTLGTATSTSRPILPACRPSPTSTPEGERAPPAVCALSSMACAPRGVPVTPCSGSAGEEPFPAGADIRLVRRPGRLRPRRGRRGVALGSAPERGRPGHAPSASFTRQVPLRLGRATADSESPAARLGCTG